MNGLSARVTRAIMRFGGMTDRRWRTLPNHLFLFNYHRIGDREKTRFDPNVYSCTAEQLEKHLCLLKERFQFITLGELLTLIDSHAAPQRPTALLTFDDGYLDAFTEALPVLEAQNVKATFFVTADFVNSSTVAWWDRVAWWTRHCSRERCYVPELGLDLQLNNQNIDTSIRLILNALKRDGRDLENSLGLLELALAPTEKLPSSPDMFMGWEHIQKLIDKGMEIGSHTVSHRILTALDDKDLADELSTSKQLIESKITAPIRSLAYPVGTVGTFDERVFQAAEAAGYEIAFTYIEKANSLPCENKYSLGRIGIDSSVDEIGLKIKTLASIRS